jgi:hypothetical protein
VTDFREEQNENAFDLMCVNSDSVSNEIDESELQYENNMKKEFEDEDEDEDEDENEDENEDEFEFEDNEEL